MGRKLRKIGFFAKTIQGSKVIFSKISCTSHNCRKHQTFAKFVTLHNTKKSGEKFSPIVTKIWHFLKCHNNCISKSVNCSHIKFSKEQLTTHTPIVKRIMVSVTNTHPSSSNALLCQTGVTNAKSTKTTKICRYCKLQHKQI